MRLWHEHLIPHLPRQQLLGQHRECCALRGNGWGKKHSVINYIFDYSPLYLFAYHERIMKEMRARGYNVDPLWTDCYYRGKKSPPYTHDALTNVETSNITNHTILFYKEHNNEYLEECLLNLSEKGIDLYDKVKHS